MTEGNEFTIWYNKNLPLLKRCFPNGSQKVIYNLGAFYWPTYYNTQKHHPVHSMRGQQTWLERGRQRHFFPQLEYLPGDQTPLMSYKCLPELDSRTNL